MFTSLGRFRRHAAVLTVLSLVASVLVVAAPAAAADPKADYTAMFDSCMSAPSANFTDVPEGHANAGDINCIAYYGITRGTSATTYSPLSSVTRKQMALFLTRLAGLVGIAVPSSPSDPGFTDTADLSAESQTAIAQLADLGITKGTSATTYSPADNVKRGHMALFIARLMDKMDPIADGQIGLSSTTQYGYTPANVAKNSKDADIGTPFTDLGTATKDEYDAITRLWELGVASGISATGYAPGSDMTRAAMAGFMASALDHSNLRPSGLSIEAAPATSWGPGSPVLLVSVRSDSFAPVEDQSVDVFSSTSGDRAIRKDGTCNFSTNPDDVNFGDFVSGDCVWDSNDEATDAWGNIITVEEVDEGTTKSFYAWIGSKSGDKFDADTVDEQMTSATANHDQASMTITSTINANADDGYDLDANTTGNQEQGQKVDLNAVSSVTFTAQLKDADGADVKRSGVKITVEYRQGPETAGPRDSRTYVNTSEGSLLTDDDGRVSWTVNGPSPDRRITNQTRADDIVFSSSGLPDAEEDVYWVEEAPVLTSDKLDSPVYVMAGSSVGVNATVRLYDQYGNPHRSHGSQKVNVTIGEGTGNSDIRQVISRGYARWTRSTTTVVNTPVAIAYDVRMLARNSKGVAVLNASGDNDLEDNDPTYNDGWVITGSNDNTPVYGTDNVLLTKPGAGQRIQDILSPGTLDLYNGRDLDEDNDLTTDGSGTVQVVRKAVSTDVGMTATVTNFLEKDNKFLADNVNDTDADTAGVQPDDDNNPEVVYSYDSGDIFIDTRNSEGQEITMDRFEALLKRDIQTPITVEVIAYDIDGVSIFRVTG